MAGSSSAIALPLAQLASGLIESANYDPAADINRQNALKIAQETYRTGQQDIVRGQVGNMLSDPYVPLGDIAANLTRVGVKPEEVGQTALVANAVRGRGEASMDDALAEAALWELAAGRSGGSTFPASTYAARKKLEPVVVGGAPRLMAAEDITDEAPVLDKSKVEGSMLSNLAASMSRPEQMRVVGAAPLSETILNYLGPDGQRGSGAASEIPTGPGYTAFSGQATGTPDQLRPTVRGALQSQSIANEQFGNMLGMAEDIARRDPTIFGAAGNVRRFAQNVGQQIANASQLAPGSTMGDAFIETQRRAAENGIQLFNPAEYDPNLADIVTMSELLVFGAAEALANQQGRSVSDKDVNLFRSIVGDPTAWTSSQEQFLSKMDLIRNVLNMKQGVIGNALGDVAAGAAAAPAAPAAAPAAPAAAPAAAPTDDADFDYVPGQGLVPRR